MMNHALILSHQNKKGSALVIVLLLVAMITALVVEFAYEIYTDTSSVANWVDSQRASLIAKSGQAFSSEYMKEVKGKDYTYTKEITLPIPIDFGPNSLLILKVEDENAKFNINSIIYKNGELNKDTFPMLKRLLAYLSIDTSLADVIADWIDPDSEPRLSDSEKNAKNSYLRSVDELKYINGMNPSTYDKLSQYITVYGDNYKLNMNTAELPVLMSLSDGMTEALGKKVIEYRESSPFKKNDDLFTGVGELTTVTMPMTYMIFKSEIFRIAAIAKSNEITRIIESVMDTSLIVHYWREG